jgi:hypothetical protein
MQHTFLNLQNFGKHMSFNKKILPPLEVFKKQIAENPQMLEYIRAADAVMGPIDTIEYLKALISGLPEESA